ncbi:RpiB/LacA/LacB family sugar-phosphate isomerase [bacterium]|nr:RpiB/LacA/LacB family sugar-phosphate isomerase [bacterium]
MKIYIAADHGGFELKETLVKYLSVSGAPVVDMGPKEYNPDDDYPKLVEPAMKKVLEDPENRAILICRNGVGVSMVANKFDGIRAGLSWTPEHAKASRTNDNTNVLGLPADYVSTQDALKIISTWLETEFSPDPRHQRRLDEIASLEARQ